jgi:hypothetical protein
VESVDVGLSVSLTKRFASPRSNHVGVELGDQHLPMLVLQIFWGEVELAVVVVLNKHVGKHIGLRDPCREKLVHITCLECVIAGGRVHGPEQRFA